MVAGYTTLFDVIKTFLTQSCKPVAQHYTQLVHVCFPPLFGIITRHCCGTTLSTYLCFYGIFFSEAKIYIYNKLKKEQKYHTKNLKKEFNESTKHTERELNYATYSPIYVFINHNH